MKNTVKIQLFTRKGAHYDIQAKDMLIDLSKQLDIDYEIIDISKQRPTGVLAFNDKEIPFFIINDKRKLKGVPHFDELKKAVEKAVDEEKEV